MKRTLFFLSIFMMSFLMMTCKPDPIGGEDDTNNDTIPEESIVRKYLVRECRSAGFGLDNPVFIIDWNDDFTRIEHITTDSGTYNQLEYDFDYYAEDSMRVSVYEPGHTAKTNYICHLEDGKIIRINYYYNSIYQKTQYRTYNTYGKLISNIDSVNNCGTIFEWEGDNLIKTYLYIDGNIEYTGNIYENFSEHIHPYYTQPHFLPGYSGDAGYSLGYITKPFWKNHWACTEEACYEYDSDGYVISVFYINEDGSNTLYARYEYDY